MSVLQISNFVGEAPSLSDRGLGAGFARVNHNLHLAATDFRPLQADTVHSACPEGTLSMYRFHRNAQGVVAPNLAAPFLTYPQLRSFAKGQINDEATERTYVSFDDGSQPPRVIDVNGGDRLLGVVRPRQPVVVHNAVDTFEYDEANTWLFGEFVEKIQQGITAASPVRTDGAAVRYGADGLAFAGAPQNYGLLTATAAGAQGLNPAMLYAMVTDARVSNTGMQTTNLGAVQVAGGWLVPVSAMPAAYPFDGTKLQQDLRLIEFPEGAGDSAGQAVLDEEQAGTLVELAAAALKPGYTTEKARAELAALVAEFATLALVKWWNRAGAQPVRPVAPSQPRWLHDQGDSSGMYENPEWAVYDRQLDAYYVAMEAYNAGKLNDSTETDALNTRMIEIQQRCAVLIASIETQLAKQWGSVMGSSTLCGQWVDKLGGVSVLASDAKERTTSTVYYVAAFETDRGEESQPSPISDMLEVKTGDTVTVARPGSVTGEELAARHISNWLVYRSNTGQTGAAWQLVKRLPITATEFLDDVPSSELDSLQPQFSWAGPAYRQDSQFDGEVKPVVGLNPYLRGFTNLANGITAAFIDNTVAFCEPYVPYAWPLDYQVRTEFPIVGQAAANGMLVVCTTSNPYIVTGAHSANMSATQLDYPYSCAAARSICAVSGGVVYASPSGLCLVQGTQVKLLTQTYYTTEQWAALDPASMFAVEHGDVCYLFHGGQTPGCIAVSVEGSAFKLGTCDFVATAAWSDKFNNALYLVQGDQLLQCLVGSARREGRYRSGLQTMPMATAFAWGKVYGDQTPDAPITLRWWGDGELVHTEVVTSMEPFRLPPGRFLEHQVEIQGAARVDRVLLASSTEELRQV